MAYAFVRATGDAIGYTHLTALDGDSTFSVSLWAKASLTGTPNYDALVSMCATTGGNGWALERYYNQAQQFQFAIYPSPYGDTYLSSGTALSTAWAHYFFAVNTDATDETVVRGWINGVEIGSWVHAFSGPMTVGTNTAPFVIGSSKTDGAGRTFQGELAEVAVWSDTNTNTGEISELAAGRLPPAVRPTGLVFYRTLRQDPDEGTGTFTATVVGATVSTHPAAVDSLSVERVVRRPAYVWTPRIGVARRTV